MLYKIQVKFLGKSSIKVNDRDISYILKGKKLLLLSYLLLHMDSLQNRKYIAFQFWPNSSEEQALTNLRKLLHSAKKDFPEINMHIYSDERFIGWKPGFPCDIDVAEFQKVLPGHSIDKLIRADELYEGPLLPGVYEEWVSAKREQLDRLHLEILTSLVSQLELKRDYPRALLYARKLWKKDELNEQACRTVMRLQALQGAYSDAASVYNRLSRLMRTELGFEPEAETQELYLQLSRVRSSPLSVSRSSEPLIGRTKEWEQLQVYWRRTISERPAMLMICGESGIGKSKLALEFRQWASRQGIPNTVSFCFSGAEMNAYYPISVWIDDLLAQSPNLDCPPELSLLTNASHDPMVSTDPNSERKKLLRAMEQVLFAHQPVLLIIEDIQWCDAETLQVFNHLLRPDQKQRFLLLATLRTGENHSHGLDELVTSLQSRNQYNDITLYPLDEDESKELLCSTDPTLHDHLPEAIYRNAVGNPLFILETLREFQQVGNLDAIPSVMHMVISNRLSQLPTQCRELVNFAAVIGHPFDLEMMAQVTKMEEDELLNAFDTLCQRNILTAVDRQFQFSHERLREVALNRLTQMQSVKLHRTIARTLERLALTQNMPGEMTGRIAFHFERGSMLSEAIHYYMLAAKHTRAVYAHHVSIEYYQKLLHLLPPCDHYQVLLQMSEVWRMVGNWREAETVLKRGLEYPSSLLNLSQKSSLKVALGTCLRLRGRYEDALIYLESALHHFKVLEEPDGTGRALGQLSIIAYYSGDYSLARLYLEERMRLPEIDKYKADNSRFAGILGRIHYEQARYDRAAEQFERQIRLGHELSDYSLVGQGMCNLAMVYLEQGKCDLAYSCMKEKLDSSREIGDRMGVAAAVAIIGRVFQLQGHPVNAEKCYLFGLKEAVNVGDLRSAIIALGFISHHCIQQRNDMHGSRFVSQLNRLSRHLRASYYICDSLCYESYMHLSNQQWRLSLRCAEEALLIAEELERSNMIHNLKGMIHQLNLYTNHDQTVPANSIPELSLDHFIPQPRLAVTRNTEVPIEAIMNREEPEQVVQLVEKLLTNM